MDETTNREVIPSNQATIIDRFAGGLIDGIIAAVLYYILAELVGWSVGSLAGAAYILVRDALPFLDGQSIGKKVMKTRAVKEDSGAPLTGDFGASVLRNVLLIIPLVSLVDAVFLFAGDHKRLGDKIAKTTVLKTA